MAKTKKSHDYRNYFLKCEKQLEAVKTQLLLNKLDDFKISLGQAKYKCVLACPKLRYSCIINFYFNISWNI